MNKSILSESQLGNSLNTKEDTNEKFTTQQ